MKERLDLGSAKKPDIGFRAFKLVRSNFRSWEGAVTDDAQLEKQLSLHIDHVAAESSTEDILYELLLKDGFPLSARIEKLDLVGKEVFSIADGALLICLDKQLTQEVIDAMADLEPQRVICLDAGFQGNDQLKANAVQTFKSRARTLETAIEFRTV
jgi:adenine-specific DNA-methyltransferase